MKYLIVNADDFGLSKGINKGIIEAFQNGIVRSTTLLVNLDGINDAVELSKKNPDLDIGLHLNLTWGKPVSNINDVSQLVDKDGNFFRSWKDIFMNMYINKIDKNQIKFELESQIRRCLDAGINPSHIDTHQHIILFPLVYYSIVELLDKYRINKLRYLQYKKTNLSDKIIKNTIKYILLWLNRNKTNHCHLQFPDYVFDIEKKSLVDRLLQLKEGVNEIISHPGHVDAECVQYSTLIDKREKELKDIISPYAKEIIEKNSIILTSYKNLKRM